MITRRVGNEPLIMYKRGILSWLSIFFLTEKAVAHFFGVKYTHTHTQRYY